MKKRFPALVYILQMSAIFGLALTIYLVGTRQSGITPAHALPEFSPRTGEPCAACHVNPGGSGPRTLRGLLWAAQGRPDKLPQLPGSMIPAEISSGLDLYDTACAGCHGYSGEGYFGINLAGRGISEAANRSFVLRGIPELGMPAFEGQFTAQQLDALVRFITELGEGQLPLDEYPLPPPQLLCDPVAAAVCGGE